MIVPLRSLNFFFIRAEQNQLDGDEDNELEAEETGRTSNSEICNDVDPELPPELRMDEYDNDEDEDNEFTGNMDDDEDSMAVRASC